MSKLYVSAITDAIKTHKTARGHHEASAAIRYNKNGGNTSDGAFSLSVLHNQDHLYVELYHSGQRLYAERIPL